MGIISHILTKPNNAFKMIIFEDVFTGNEVFSDAYPCKLIDDFVWEAEGMVITIDNSIDDSAIGGNASAEDAAEDTEDVKETAINLVYAFKLKPYELDKKAYTKHIKDYDVYINEDYNEDGMLPLLNYREDGVTPYFTYFAAGVNGVKC